MDCEQKKLLPIITSSELYRIITVKEFQFLPSQVTTVLKSVDQRIRPGCPFTRFEGPDWNSSKVTVLAPGYNGNLGEEAIYGALPNYLYKVNWKLEGCRAQFWSINLNPLSDRFNYAYQLLDVNGNRAILDKPEGSFTMYGYHFPIVLELDPSYAVELTITLEKYLDTQTNPFFEGLHCVKGNYVYDNSTTDELGVLRRVMAPRLQEFSQNYRNNFFQAYRGPCIKNLVSSQQVTKTQILSILSKETVDGYYRSYCSTSLIGCFKEDISTNYRFFRVGNVTDSNGDTIKTTLFVDSDVNVTVNVNITMVFYDDKPYCTNQYKLGFYKIGETTGYEILGVRDGIANMKFSSSFDMKLQGGSNFFFGGYGFITFGLNGYGYPDAITGTVTITQ